MGARISDHVRREKAGEFASQGWDTDFSILERTGPGIWSTSVHDYFMEAGGLAPEALAGGGRVGDVRVLPQTALGCPAAFANLKQPAAYVYHQVSDKLCIIAQRPAM
jgi:hypothetical protein